MKVNSWVSSGAMKVVSSAVLVFTLCCSGVPEVDRPARSSSGSAVYWQAHDEDILESARQDGYPVILNFSADWCPPCHELDEVTFSDPRVIESLNDFVMVKVDLTDWDTPESNELKRQYGVAGVPELHFLDLEGNEIQELRVVGFLGPEYFLRRAAFAFASARATLSMR